MKFILGTKIGMTRVFDDEGRSFAVTKIKALQCEVSAVKTKEKDGYNAIKVMAYKIKNEKRKTIKEAEFIEPNAKKFKKGDAVTLKNFKNNETVSFDSTGKTFSFANTFN